MKNFTTHRSGPDLDTLETRVGVRVAARLSEQAQRTPHDVSERLRFAREQALLKAQQARAASAAAATAAAPVAVTHGGAAAAILGFGGKSSWWVRLGSVVPLIVLVGGLMLIQQIHDRASISAAAELDAQLLSDDLPPAAYSDPGFAEFLRAPQDN